MEKPPTLGVFGSSRSLLLNLPEFPVLVSHYKLPAANLISPLPDLCSPGHKGTPRQPDEMFEPIKYLAPGTVQWVLTPLAIPDRILDARIALFNAAPIVSRLYSSRKADNLFVSIKPHMEYDRELVFPVSKDDLLVWLELQLQFSSSFSYPEPWQELSAVQLAFLLALCDAYKTVFIRSFLPRVDEPDPVTVTLADILEAQEAALKSADRRWITTAVREFLGLMIHIGGRSGVDLPVIGVDFAQAEIARYMKAGHLRPVPEKADGHYELGAGMSLMAGTLFNWISILSLHDLQIVGGEASAPAGVEELLLFITTGSSIWLLASEGLLEAKDDLSPVRFGLRSLQNIDSLDVANEFLQPIPEVNIPDGFYLPPQKAQPRLPQVCPRCSTPVQPGTLYCTHCGMKLPADQGEAVGQPAAALQTCPKCGTPVQPGYAFCTHCGMKLLEKG